MSSWFGEVCFQSKLLCDESQKTRWSSVSSGVSRLCTTNSKTLKMILFQLMPIIALVVWLIIFLGLPNNSNPWISCICPSWIFFCHSNERTPWVTLTWVTTYFFLIINYSFCKTFDLTWVCCTYETIGIKEVIVILTICNFYVSVSGNVGYTLHLQLCALNKISKRFYLYSVLQDK